MRAAYEQRANYARVHPRAACANSYEQRANYERELTRELLRDAPLWSAPSTRKRKTEEPRNEGAGLAHGYGVPSQKVRLGFGAIENAISEENV